jgi:cell division protein FtsB
VPHNEEGACEDSAALGESVNRRIDDMDRSYSRWAKVLTTVMMLGAGTAIVVWADTRELTSKEPLHATKAEVAQLAADRTKVDKQQNRALNWQTKAIRAIARKVGAGDDLPEAPDLIEGDGQ